MLTIFSTCINSRTDTSDPWSVTPLKRQWGGGEWFGRHKNMIVKFVLNLLFEENSQELWFANYSSRIPWDRRPFPLGSIDTFRVMTTLKFTYFLKWNYNVSRNFLNWRHLYFLWKISKKFPEPTKRATVILFKVRSCSAMLNMLLVCISIYLKSNIVF